MDKQKLEEFIKFCNDGYARGAEGREDRSRDFSEELLACLGLAEESGEIVGLHKKYIAYGDRNIIQRNDLVLELGDLFHYFCRVCYLHGIQLDEVIDRNIEKISARRINTKMR